VGSIKNTAEEVTETDDERKSRETSGSWRKGNGRALECPLTGLTEEEVKELDKSVQPVRSTLFKVC